MKRKVFLIAMMFCMAVLSACGAKTVTYNTEDYLNVSVSGVDGAGNLVIESIPTTLMDKVNKDVFSGEASEIDLASMMVNIAAYTDYSVNGEKENLSNGDTVTFTMTADNESLKKLGLEFSCNDYVFTVSGLQEPVELDVWTGFEVVFDGVAPDGWAEAAYNGSNSFVKDNVKYSFIKSHGDTYGTFGASGLSNGDTVIVKADCNQSLLDENLYLLGETEKEFTAEGLSFYPADLNGYDLSDIENTLLELAKDKMDSSTYMDAFNSGSRIYNNKVFKDGSAGSKEWSVTGEYTIKPVHKYILADKEDNAGQNIYTVFYEVTVPLEKTYIDEWNVRKDSYNEGDTYDLILYIESHMRNIVADGSTLDTSEAQTGATAFGSSFSGNYIGSSLDEVEEEYNKSYSEWIKTDVNQ